MKPWRVSSTFKNRPPQVAPARNGRELLEAGGHGRVLEGAALDVQTVPPVQ